MVAGNVYLENKIGVAEGFPTRDLGPDDMITTTEVANMLGVKEGQSIRVEVSFSLVSGSTSLNYLCLLLRLITFWRVCVLYRLICFKPSPQILTCSKDLFMITNRLHKRTPKAKQS